jgi:hypothetical protein
VLENVTKGFGHGVRRVDGAPDVFKDDVALRDPILQREVLDIYVATAVGRAAGVGHHDGCGIVLEQDGCLELHETKFDQDGPEILRDFGGTNGRHEFSISGAEADGCYLFGAVCDSSSCEAENVCPYRPASTETICMSRIQIAAQFIDSTRRGHRAIELFRGAQVGKGDMREINARGRAPINQSLEFCLTEVSVDTFQRAVVDRSWIGREL